MNFKLNGEEREYASDTVSYETIVSMLGYASGTCLSVTYCGQQEADYRRAGTLLAGELLILDPGMSIDAYHTGNA